MRKALILEGIVYSILDADPFPPFHPSLVWVECPPDVKDGWRFDAGEFSQPPSPTLEELKANALSALNAMAQNLANHALAEYPEFETKTWEDQRREAVAWDADNNADTPYIDALSGYRGLDRVEYINRTLAKIASFTAFSTRTVGLRQNYADQIDAATDEETLNAIVFDFS